MAKNTLDRFCEVWHAYFIQDSHAFPEGTSVEPYISASLVEKHSARQDELACFVVHVFLSCVFNTSSWFPLPRQQGQVCVGEGKWDCVKGV